MEFEKIVSSLDAEGLSRAAEVLLRLLSGGAAEKTLSISPSASERETRTGGFIPLSSPGAERPLPGEGSAGKNGLAAAGGLSSSLAGVSGGEAARGLSSPTAAMSGEGAVGSLSSPIAAVSGRRAAGILSSPIAAVPGGEATGGGTRRGSDSARGPRSPGAETAAEIARLENRLAAVSARNRRALGAGAGVETLPRPSADDPAAAGGDAAGPERFSAFPTPRSGSGAAAVTGETDMEAAVLSAGAAEPGFFDAEAVSEFFRRDSRRYDSGFSD